MITVIATIETAPGRRNDLLGVLGRNVPNVLREKGCVQYAPLVDLPTMIGAQVPVRDNVVTVVEKWEDMESLEAHLIAPHMIAYRKEVQQKGLVQSVSLQILRPAGG